MQEKKFRRKGGGGTLGAGGEFDLHVHEERHVRLLLEEVAPNELIARTNLKPISKNQYDR